MNPDYASCFSVGFFWFSWLNYLSLQDHSTFVLLFKAGFFTLQTSEAYAHHDSSGFFGNTVLKLDFSHVI